MAFAVRSDARRAGNELVQCPHIYLTRTPSHTVSHFVWRVDDSHSARVARPLLVS
jgi:hypothetical protein